MTSGPKTTEEPGAERHGAAPSRALRVLVGTAALVVVGVGVRAASSLLGPILLALVLVIAVAPVRRVAMRHRWPSWIGGLLMLITAYAIVVFLAVSLAVSLVRFVATLPEYASQANAFMTHVRTSLSHLGFAKDPTAHALGSLDLSRLTSFLAGVLGGLLGVLSSIFFLASVLFFLAVDAASVHVRAEALQRMKPAMVRSLNNFVHATQTYVLMTALFGGIVAALDTVALWLIGVPQPLLWGLLSFVTNFIPNIGFVIGLIPPALLGLLDGGWREMLLVIAVYCALNLVIQTFIQPRLVGDAVGLNATVTFLSLAVWTFLLGPLGALLAVPMTLLVRALLIAPDPSARWADVIIGRAADLNRAVEVDGPDGEAPPAGAASPAGENPSPDVVTTPADDLPAGKR